MEERNSSSPETVIPPEVTRAYDELKNEAFIQIYCKRSTYFKRWRKMTKKYFKAVNENNQPAIKRYDKRIESKRQKFIERFKYAELDNKTVPSLLDIDVLKFPQNVNHRRELIKQEDEYKAKNQQLNPDTTISNEEPGKDGLSADEPVTSEWQSDTGS
ncbi:hypothetical protein TSTA_123430 [Talaromyces stipitatus ATCC 10500]|uniref:Uncharacterized protein n=1 Tax=Talaromyces stipitatus (strain ATCC 10500 / CBS 375.48 / QM 6759 / NRRL 1006) TaxID=441959 RepID=B8MAA8_TALSN|nr:uncharacterized protein TSTA_123430 [Talaromyces stipitatus ATCC 10500]EED18610.1 hypothetical protein TSTA_123430 [Talaromyces stipitatus ATCC 10500]